tara:strand:- start:1274 stop:2725 length:1452 start_codon:yes stop_codon:yes gene_type:complete
VSTPNLNLTELANGQANYLNANEALAVIDALLQTPVISMTLTTAPASPANGALYIMASAWAGITGAAAGRLALYRTGSGWIVITPKTGWKKEVLADGLTYRYNGADWLEWIASSATAWGDITGSPDDNAALAAALDAKEDAVQDNLSASVPPTVDNDETEGYAPRSRWFDIVAGESYLCLSAATGAAVWVQTSLTLDELGSAAMANVGTADSELPTNLTVMNKITAWWNSITSAFGRGFVASADAAAGRAALGLGTFATANYAAAPFVNVMPDSGRFAGKMNPLALSAGSFVTSGFFDTYNGSTQSSAGKFIHNNTTNGGSAGALTEPVTSLLTKLGRSSASARYGTEFYVLRITAGSGTQTPGVGTDAVTRYLLSINNTRALFGSDGKSTFVGYLRCVSGSAHIGLEHYQDGVLVPAGTPLGAGWRHCRVVLDSAIGYDNGYPRIQTTSGAAVELALASFFTGVVDVGLHKSPLLTINELSA